MTDKKFHGKKISIIMAAFLLLFCMGSINCKAQTQEKTDTEIIEEIRTYSDSIVRVESICSDGRDKIYQTKSFSGFVVSGDSTGIHVVTVCNDLAYSENEKKEIREKYQLEEHTSITEKVEVVFSGDLRVGADIVGKSDQRNVSVLQLGQSVNFKNALKFEKEDAPKKEKVFLLSYPSSAGESSAAYTAENVEIIPGEIVSAYQTDDIIFLTHTIQAEMGSAGGPLLNQNGQVVGIFLASDAGGKSTALSAQALKEFLSTLNVSYQEYQKVILEKKLPILNIILGVIILGLLAVAIRQKFGNVFLQNQSEDVEPVSQRKGKKKTKTKAKTKMKTIRKKETSGKIINARLEYPAENRMVMIQKNFFVIGRMQESDFLMSASKGISRRHAGIKHEGNDYYLSDLESTNHTFLNGLEVLPGERKILRDGDEIMVGKEKLIFYIGK